jgi:subtilisin family serine protease
MPIFSVRRSRSRSCRSQQLCADLVAIARGQTAVAITVGASTIADSVATFSNTGNCGELGRSSLFAHLFGRNSHNHVLTPSVDLVRPGSDTTNQPANINCRSQFAPGQNVISVGIASDTATMMLSGTSMGASAPSFSALSFPTANWLNDNVSAAVPHVSGL